MLPIVLILLAVVASAGVAFGMRPDWVVWWPGHGLDVILWSRRGQWPLTAVAILLCVALVGLVVAGRRRVFWLLGLGPVVGMLFYHFSGDPMNGFGVRENPAMVSAAQADVGDQDYVVGLKFGDETYAYPYAALYADPVVYQLERGKRLLLVWNAFANRAVAWTVDQDVTARELELVSMPGNAVLLYNSRLGQFINGVTGKRPGGDKPTGFNSPVTTTKTTWGAWRAAHPGTKVMALVTKYDPATLPRRAVLPYYGMPAGEGELAGDARVTLVGREGVVAVESAKVSEKPMGVEADGVPVMVVRDSQTGQVRAFDRRIEEGVVGEFTVNTDARRKGVAWVEGRTGTGWSAAGVFVDGGTKWKGKRLEAVPVDEDVYYGVVRYWVPGLKVAR